MAVERTFYCEGPTCDIPRDEPVADDDRKPTNGSTAVPPPHLLVGWIQTRERLNGVDYTHDFCSWDCLMKFAAEKPLPIIDPMGRHRGRRRCLSVRERYA